MKKILLAILIPFLITGCATKYHKKNLFGGYSNQKFEKDIYQVGFDASIFTDRDLIEQYIQYRCAEIVIEQGYQYYTIINNYTPSSYNTITIKIYEEEPNILDVRDANEVITNLKDVVDYKKIPNAIKYVVGILTIWVILDMTNDANNCIFCLNQ